VRAAQPGCRPGHAVAGSMKSVDIHAIWFSLCCPLPSYVAQVGRSCSPEIMGYRPVQASARTLARGGNVDLDLGGGMGMAMIIERLS